MPQTAATTTTTAWYQGSMAAFTGKPIVAVDQSAIDYQSAAHACSQGVHRKMFHTLGTSINHFSNGGCVGIVGQRHRLKRRELCLDQLNQGNNAFERQIRSMFDGTRIKIAIGRT